MTIGLADPAAPPQALSVTGRIGLGCSRIGSFNNPQPLRDSLRLLAGAYDLGVRVFDTANIYGQGDSERAIGSAFTGARRQDLFLVTKAGRQFSARARALGWAKPVIRPLLAMRGRGGLVSGQREAALLEDWRPEALALSLEGSLRRLRTDYVDAFLLHSPPVSVAGDPAVGAALDRLRQAGKARHVGISCDTIACLRAALTLPQVTVLQLPLDVLAEAQPLVPQIARRGIRVIAREVIRQRPGLPAPQALAMALADPLVTCALVGTTRLAHLAEICAG